VKVKGLLKKEEHQRQKRLLQEKALLKVCSINRCISQKERKFSLSSSALPLLLLDDDFPKKTRQAFGNYGGCIYCKILFSPSSALKRKLL